MELCATLGIWFDEAKGCSFEVVGFFPPDLKKKSIPLFKALKEKLKQK